MPGQTPQDARSPHPLPQEALCPSHEHPDCSGHILPAPVASHSSVSSISLLAPTQLPPHPSCHTSPALPACPPSAEATGVRWGGLPRGGAWMHPLPCVFLLPTGSPQRARQEDRRVTALSAKNSLAAGHLRSTEGKPFFSQTIAQVPSGENSRPAFSPGSVRQALCHQRGLDQRERAKGEGLTFKSGWPPQPWAGPEAMRSS